MAKKLKIKGVIIPNDYKWLYDWFEMDYTCPSDVDAVLDEANGEEIEVEINSPGGDVYTGSEIYTKLKSYKGKITTDIVGVAASAASVIAMAGHVRISPTAQIMIHNASSVARGDYRDMQHAADFLEGWNKSIANSYILKTGMKQEELLDLMNNETWLSAKQAKDLGFADEILFDEGNRLVASSVNGFMFPPEVINKLRNLLKDQEGNKPQTTTEQNNNQPDVFDVEKIANTIAKALLENLSNKQTDAQLPAIQDQDQDQVPQNNMSKLTLQAKLNLLKLGGMTNE
jgi:ATP-dependent protease ClpP protease subunit